MNSPEKPSSGKEMQPEELGVWRSLSSEATFRLGEALGRRLKPSQGLGLAGELGAGKTVFVRGLAKGMQVEAPEEVRSPTWMLMVEHPGPLPLLHMDAYFSGRGEDFLADGGEAYLQEGGVLAVEWADRLAWDLPEDFLQVHIDHESPETRRIQLCGQPEVWAACLEGLAEGLDEIAVIIQNG